MTATNDKKLPGLTTLWQWTKGDPDIRIAILDGPVNRNHQSLQQAKLKDFRKKEASQGIKSFHGTFVTSVVFGQHGSSVPGVAPNCQGLLFPVYQEDNQGNLIHCNQIELAQTIREALSEGANIINLSGGELISHGEAYPLLEEAIADCEQKGVLVVAASGNNGCECLHSPAVLPSVLAVGSMGDKGLPSKFSNWDKSLQSHGLLVPGEDILGAVSSEDLSATAYASGTSFSTPLLTGVAALLASRQKQIYERFDLLAIRQILLDTAIPCIPSEGVNCDQFLGGQLNLSAALERLQVFSFYPTISFQEATMSNDQKNPAPTAMQNGVPVSPASAQSTPSIASQSVSMAQAVPQAAPQMATVATGVHPQQSALGQSAPMVGTFQQVVPQSMGMMSQQATPQAVGIMPQQVAPQNMGVMPQQVIPQQAGNMEAMTNSTQIGMQPQQVVVPSGMVHPQAIPQTAGMLYQQVMPQMMPHTMAPMMVSPQGVAPHLCANCQSQGVMIPSQQASPAAATPPVLPKQANLQGALINHKNAELVFMLGELSYDFGFDARFDTFRAQMEFWYDHQLSEDEKAKYTKIPHDPYSLAGFLRWEGDESTGEYPYVSYANALIWTLNLDVAPVYAIRPDTQFSIDILKRLTEFLQDQSEDALGADGTKIDGDPVRMSLAGHVSGTTRLQNGDVIPSISPVLRGMYNWRIEYLVGGIDESYRDQFCDFMKRLYVELRNFGRTSEERALNYSAFNLTQHKEVFQKAIADDLTFKSFTTTRSKICRKDSDCIDVELTFFNPKKKNDVAPRTFAFTIDCSDIVPIAIGEMKQWDSYGEK